MLSDIKVKSLKVKSKPYKLADGGGLYIEVMTSGSKMWRYKYRINGKEKRISFGPYPTISLKDARSKHQAAKKDVIDGIDPSAKRKSEKLASTLASHNSFESIAREWLERHKTRWTQSHAKKLLSRLENDVFPWLGGRPISEIEPPELLESIRRIENRGALDSAHRTLQTCGQIFRYAVATGRTNRDVTSDLRGALPPVKKSNFAAITNTTELGLLLNDIRQYQGSLITKTAMKMLPYVFVRPGELRNAEWSEFDLENSTWTIPASKMKMNNDHIVPLSTQVKSLLDEIQPLTGISRFVFHGARSTKRPMSNNTILAALRNLGYTKEQIAPHGFRATARTLLDEELEFPPHIIEHQLAHAVKDANGRAYNRTAHLPQRKGMMQQWADYLDKLAADSK